ncbi:protein of unknown function [Parapedobacter composti]|uniref:DUF5655 domain-containing protein n=1 Tax=Parapedobacter composti TaxID=623281 RepID=A0A1I1FAV5_9SPHI|nr:DUF5655 domain-containing protein [Parapedobacter composti]SFB96609.1 protein of unknown function [Parapedobacter composti]
MALGPKQMGEAIIRNLKEKTGKSIEEWIALLEKQELKGKKEIMAFLKTDYGLGHFQAQKVFEHYSGKDHYEDPHTFAKKIFDTKKSWELYDFCRSKILLMAKDIRVQPCKTYIPFYRKNKFAMLTKTKDDVLLLGLTLPENPSNPRFTAIPVTANDRINARTTIRHTSDFDEEIMSAVKNAYKIS